jgi:hypothetical protein
VLGPLRELVATLRTLRLTDLAVGKDGRNRFLLSPFRTKTGRNAPSNGKFVFGPSRWIRGLIKPSTGYGIAYIDWSSQEFGIAAALSADEAMMEAYRSGDPYTWLGKRSGAIPADADKTHRKRELFKVCALALESKDDIKKRGLRSPDIADALGADLCCAGAAEMAFGRASYQVACGIRSVAYACQASRSNAAIDADYDPAHVVYLTHITALGTVEGAQSLINWLVSPTGQKVIADYKIDGQQLFFPNANVPGA